MFTPLFDLGNIEATPGAYELLTRTHTQPRDLLKRHVQGDWGDVSEHDAAENNFALDKYLRILSAYHLDGVKIWLITEADRSQTTFLLPSEY